MTEEKDLQEDRLDRLLSIVERQEQQIEKIMGLLKLVLVAQRRDLSKRAKTNINGDTLETAIEQEVRSNRLGNNGIKKRIVSTIRAAVRSSLRLTPEALLIAAFMVLMIGAILQLFLGVQTNAQRLSEASYYLLTVGIVIRLVRYVYEWNKRQSNTITLPQ